MTFKETVQAMGQWNVSALPVMEGEGRVIGAVSDLLLKEDFRGWEPDRREELLRPARRTWAVRPW